VGKGGTDYDKLVDQFGCQRRNAALVHGVARLTAARRTSSSAGTSSSPTGILGGEVLPVHGEGALVRGAAPRSPHPLHVHQISAEGFQGALISYIAN